MVKKDLKAGVNIECTELILRIILNNPDIQVQEVRTQREIKNLRGHSVRLGIEAKDADGRPIDVEVQRSDKGASWQYTMQTGFQRGIAR